MVDLAISSSDRHSSVVIVVGLLLCLISLIWHLMISTSCVISFHRAKICHRTSTDVDGSKIALIRLVDNSIVSGRLLLYSRLVDCESLCRICVLILLSNNNHRLNVKACVVSRIQYAQRVFTEKESYTDMEKRETLWIMSSFVQGENTSYLYMSGVSPNSRVGTHLEVQWSGLGL